LGDVEFLEENTIDRQLNFLLHHTEIVKEKEKKNNIYSAGKNRGDTPKTTSSVSAHEYHNLFSRVYFLCDRISPEVSLSQGVRNLT
jgi:hypothetical protein